MIGRTLSHYRILKQLGAGGMGIVYLARDTRLDRAVALKVLPQEFARDATLLARFRREAKTVAALNHPNIATLYSVEEADGVRFLTMELVEGQRLDALLAPGGLPLPRILDLALPLTDALVAAHEKGIVHRDLKPTNVMVTKDGRVKVLDFGLAKLAVPGGAMDPEATQGAAVTSPLTSTGQVVGTVPYMAPEQLRGEAVDARSDLFALGIMLYELVTGQRPFTGKSLSDVTSSILRDAPTPMTALRPGLPRDIARIVGRCLEKAPRERFQTARDVYNELRLVRKELEGADSARADSPALLSAPIADDTPSIAVLPFVNMSKDEENEYFADGLSEELLNVLAKIRGLRVVSRTSAFHFKGKDVDLATVAQKLNVATILEGSVRKSGRRVRITAQLIQVSTDSHLWSETYDRELEDIFAVQDDIAQSVVKEARAALLGEKPDASASAKVKAEVEAAAKGRRENAEAYRLYLQGRFFTDRRTREGAAKGIEYYRQALELDPGYALAWAGLARAYTEEAVRGWASIAEGFGRAREAAERALVLEPDLAEGYVALGWVRMSYDWDWKGAESSMRRALELAPGKAEVVRGAAFLAMIMGRLMEAIELERRAVALDPLSFLAHYNLGIDCSWAGLPEEAASAFRKAIELNPQGAGAHYFLGNVHLAQGRVGEAFAAFEQESDEAFRLLGLTLAQHGQGRSAESEAALRELIERHSEGAAYQIAQACAYRGEADRAFQWLERAYAQRDPGLAWMRPNDLLHNLHGDPRWQPFLEKMGFAN
jgi:serine/threonine-protein kinase